MSRTKCPKCGLLKPPESSYCECEDDLPGRNFWKIGGYIVGGVIAIWGLSFIGLFYFDSLSESGQFGDSFGSINALFSGLAFAILIYAMLLQKQELSLQRKELRLQREEMAASRRELAAQVSAQEALFKATVGQIHVAAEQARIEATKMVATDTGVHGQTAQLRINEIADKIEKTAKDILPYDEDYVEGVD